MGVLLETSTRNSLVDSVIADVDAGSGAAKLLFYVGTPASLGILLATLTLNDPAAPASAAGTATFGTIVAATTVAAGTVGAFQIEDSDANVILGGTVGLSGEDINFNAIAWDNGDNISVTALTMTMPAV